MPHVPDSLYFLVEIQRKAEESAKKEAEARQQAEAAKRSELETRFKAAKPRSFRMSSAACFFVGLSVLGVLAGAAILAYRQGLMP